MTLKSVADFSLPMHNGQTFRLSEHRGQYVVLYFYPKDDTPGCTDESCQFRDNYPDFSKLDAVVVGISRDSVNSHQKFQSKYDLPFPLLADTEETLCQYFDVIKPKNRYGKMVRGIERSTFIINPEGLLIQEWRKVKVPGHAQMVLDFLRAQTTLSPSREVK